MWTSLEGLHITKWNLLHGYCTDVHNGFNNENHRNSTHKTVLIPVHSLLTLIKFEPVHIMKAHNRKGVTPLILNLGTDGGMWSTTCPGYFTPKGNTTSYPLNRRLGAPGADKSLTWNAFSFCTFKPRTRYIMLAPNFSSKKY